MESVTWDRPIQWSLNTRYISVIRVRFSVNVHIGTVTAGLNIYVSCDNLKKWDMVKITVDIFFSFFRNELK